MNYLTKPLLILNPPTLSMPESQHTRNPRVRLLNLRMVGAYYVAEVEGRYIVCGDSECFLVEAGSPEDAVEAVDDYLRGVLGVEE